MSTVTPGTYRHFKGTLYRVIGVARHSETEEEHVVYVRADDANEAGDAGAGADLWVRPLAMWNERVALGDYEGPRFVRVDETEGHPPARIGQ